MKDIREKNTADLTQFVGEKRTELRKLRFGTAGSNLRNTRATRTARRDIARALTEMNARAQKGA
jgi:ribosomal protein L29